MGEDNKWVEQKKKVRPRTRTADTVLKAQEELAQILPTVPSKIPAPSIPPPTAATAVLLYWLGGL